MVPLFALIGPELRVLNLADCGLSEDLIKQIVLNTIGESGERSSSLQFINLEKNNMGEEGALAVADLLRVCPQMKEFHYKRAYPGCAGTKAILYALPASLRVLDLGEAHFDKESCNLLNNLLMKGCITTLLVGDASNLDVKTIISTLMNPECGSKPTKINFNEAQGDHISFYALLEYLEYVITTKHNLECFSANNWNIDECPETERLSFEDKTILFRKIFAAFGNLSLRVLSIEGWNVGEYLSALSMAQLLCGASSTLEVLYAPDNWEESNNDEAVLGITSYLSHPNLQIVLEEDGFEVEMYFHSVSNMSTLATAVVDSLASKVSSVTALDTAADNSLETATKRAFALILYCCDNSEEFCIDEWVNHSGKIGFKEIPKTAEAVISRFGNAGQFKRLIKSIQTEYKMKSKLAPVSLKASQSMELIAKNIFSLVVTYDELATFPDSSSPVASPLVCEILQSRPDFARAD